MGEGCFKVHLLSQQIFSNSSVITKALKQYIYISSSVSSSINKHADESNQLRYKMLSFFPLFTSLTFIFVSPPLVFCCLKQLQGTILVGPSIHRSIGCRIIRLSGSSQNRSSGGKAQEKIQVLPLVNSTKGLAFEKNRGKLM